MWAALWGRGIGSRVVVNVASPSTGLVLSAHASAVAAAAPVVKLQQE